MSDLTMKAFFGSAAVIRALRLLGLPADAEFLALGFAMNAIIAQGGMTAEDALKLLKELFEKNLDNAKAVASRRNRGDQ